MSASNHAGQARVSPAALDRTGLFHLLVVYIVWGSTYLAIRIAVGPGGGFTPFFMGTMRALAAGLILLAWGALSRSRLRLTRKEFLVLFASGILLWTGGNGLVMVGELRVDSGLAALIIGSTPFVSAIIESIWDRRPPTLRLVGALLIGMAGIAVLSYPVLRSGVRGDILSVLAIFGATITWAFGSVLQNRYKPDLAPTVNSSYQLLFGAVGFIVMTLLTGEKLPQPSLNGWLAWGYLVLFGSVLAFTSYVQTLRLLPAKIATTYAYVNPVIAVFLGRLILNEPITIWTLAGAALVLFGVTAVFREHNQGH